MRRLLDYLRDMGQFAASTLKKGFVGTVVGTRDLLREIDAALFVRRVNRMGQMREIEILGRRIGLESWGRYRPAQMWNAAGECWQPWALGIWFRAPESDRTDLVPRLIEAVNER